MNMLPLSWMLKVETEGFYNIQKAYTVQQPRRQIGKHISLILRRRLGLKLMKC
jgi:hypothetical protein